MSAARTAAFNADLDCLHAVLGLLIPFPDRPPSLRVHTRLRQLRLGPRPRPSSLLRAESRSLRAGYRG